MQEDMVMPMIMRTTVRMDSFRGHNGCGGLCWGGRVRMTPNVIMAMFMVMCMGMPGCRRIPLGRWGITHVWNLRLCLWADSAGAESIERHIGPHGILKPCVVPSLPC